MSPRHWFRLLALVLFCVLNLLFGAPWAVAADWDEQLPSTSYYGAAVPDWNNLSFSSLPAMEQGGDIQVPQSAVNQLGYDPSVTWQAGDSAGDVLKLGSLHDLGVDQFRLSDIAQVDHINLSNASLSNFPLLKQQTISSLVDAVPHLGHYQLNQVQPLSDLVQSNVGQTGFGDLQNRLLSDIASTDNLGNLSLNNLNLNDYSFSQIPELDQTQLGSFQGWQDTTINQTPGLSSVPLSQFPNSPLGFLGFIAIHDVTYGYKEHRVKTTAHSITGSNKVGFHYPCVQENGCAYLELNSPISLGIAGDPLGLHGAQWIKGGRSPGGQMVPGGEGVLGAVNGGLEPTGRLPFGSAFKVVLIETVESKGEGQFGLFFRYCHHGVPELGCTPYFIGPVPWLPSHEKGLVFVGETQGTAPSGIQSPPVPQEVQDIVKQYGGDTGDGTGTGYGYGSDCAGKLTSAAPTADRSGAATNIPKILSAAQQYGVTDPGQIAYILATVQGEVDFNPRDEGDGYSASGDCGSYCGRGDVQLTFQDNYARAGQALGIDLVNHPEMANDPDIAAKIAVLGMKNGWFTGARLGNYIHGSMQDYGDARQIVNDSDRSDELAGYAQRYYQVLSQCNVSTGGATTSQTYAGQFISQANGNATEQKIVAAINRHYGESTADGPAGGDEACAWELNRVLQDAIGHPVGSNPNYEPSIEAALSSGAGTRVSPTQAHAGDVVVFDNPATNQGHIGFCEDDGCTQVISNSSSRAAFTWSESRSAYDADYGVNSSSHIYRVNP